MSQVSLFSFFSGLGFLDLGFEQCGYEIVLVNEKYPTFIAAYKYAREKMGIHVPRYGYSEEDVTSFLDEPRKRASLSQQISQIRLEGQLAGFIGGPPCPDFSMSGKNLGRNGKHGPLSQTYVEIICQQKPDLFLFENVKGLWRTKRHREFYEELKEMLRTSGYITTEHLINAIEYGVPQDRPRIILIGFQKALLERSSLIPGITTDLTGRIYNGFPWAELAPYPGHVAFDFKWPCTERFEENSQRPCPSGLPEELTVQYWFEKNHVTHHPNAHHAFKPRAGLARFMAIEEGDDTGRSFKRLHRWRYSPTACYGNNEVHLHPYKPRRISVSEALAIQSVPEEFELPACMTLSDMFKGIANGVPYLAAKQLALTILKFLGIGDGTGEGDGRRPCSGDTPSAAETGMTVR